VFVGEKVVVLVEVAVHEGNARSMLSIFLRRCWQRLRGDCVGMISQRWSSNALFSSGDG
jgi:hypothetical protein